MLACRSVCWLCQLPLFLNCHGICSFCLAQIPPLPCTCPQCGLVAEFDHQPCPQCQRRPPNWHHLVAVSDYRAPLIQLIHQFKVKKQSMLSQALARLLLLKWMTARRYYQWPKPDMLLSVPLAHKRHWQRGFNQTQLLTEHLSYWLQCPYQPTLLTRCASKRDQKTLTAKERLANVEHQFTCLGDLTGKTVALVDDVVTTGCTANAICRQLNAKGAATIYLLCLCRTL